MTPVELLEAARQLIRRHDAATAGLWPRAGALLARQALEEALDAYWNARGLALGECPMRPQLVCLREYLPDTELAGRVEHAWSALSRACHHHPYELAPTAGELEGWVQVVGEFVTNAEVA
jgi:hypothetical protein